MAENKKSFLLYCDIIHLVKKLPDDKAGELFKHILAYVNDENPQTDDFVIEIAFEPIKQALKRDLQKYEKTCSRNKENAKKRWDKSDAKNATGTSRMRADAKHADIDIDIDSDIDIDIDNNNKNIIINKEEKIYNSKANLFMDKQSLEANMLEETYLLQTVENTCKLTKEVARSKIKEFINVKALDLDKSYSENCKHFLNWVQKQQQDKKNINTNQNGTATKKQCSGISDAEFEEYRNRQSDYSSLELH